MRRFARLYLALDATNATGEKVALLEDYFRHAAPADASWVVTLIAGERPRGVTSSRALRDLAIEVTGWPAWLVAESYEQVGDLSETVALLVGSHLALRGSGGRGERADSDGPGPLHVFMRDRVLALAGRPDEQKKALIADTWRLLGDEERLVYHKLIRGGFRVGVKRGLLTRALAGAFGLDRALVAQRLTGRIEPTRAFFESLVARGETERDRAARPYPFFLAHQVELPGDGDGASALRLAMGDVGGWQAEWKWDGIRAQLIRRAKTVELWSRGDEVLTHQFPEIVAAARGLGDCVLDGEVLVWRGDGPRPFAELQTRLNRAAPPPAQLGLFGEPTHAVYIAYDVLEEDGEDVRARPLRERRGRLERVTEPALGGVIRLSEVLESDSWEGLAALREQADRRGTEGLMLKHRDSVYGVGRTKADQPERGGGWWKWKVDPCTVDAVLVASQPGSGRRASLYTDHTFALWGENNEGERELVTFAKAYSGLSNDEIERLDRWVRSHTTGRAGPVRFVEHEHVFELGFEGVRESGRHKAGLAVRFPRILRWRTDKSPGDADTLASLRAMVRDETAGDGA
ncbi:MAG: ATP-dependent DNA ligase [Phycisphaerales bacterium JB040]